MKIRSTAGFVAGIPSLVGEGRRFYQDDALLAGVSRKFFQRYATHGKYGYHQLHCPQCRLLGVRVWFTGKGGRTRLHHHLEDHYAIKVLGRDETLWAKDCQARQQRLRGVTLSLIHI